MQRAVRSNSSDFHPPNIVSVILKSKCADPLSVEDHAQAVDGWTDCTLATGMNRRDAICWRGR